MPATVIPIAIDSWPLLEEPNAEVTRFGGASQQSEHSFHCAYANSVFCDKESSRFCRSFTRDLCRPYQPIVSFTKVLIHADFVTLNWNYSVSTMSMHISLFAMQSTCNETTSLNSIKKLVSISTWFKTSEQLEWHSSNSPSTCLCTDRITSPATQWPVHALYPHTPSLGARS